MKATLYLYVDGSDLEDVCTLLESELEELINSRDWAFRPWRVDQVRPSASLGDLPDWELGLNLELPSLPSPPAQSADRLPLLADLEALVRGLEAVARRTGREFVVGVGLASGMTEDLGFVPGARAELLLEQIGWIV